MKVRVRKGNTITRDAVYGESDVLDVPAADARALIAAGRAEAIKDEKETKRRT